MANIGILGGTFNPIHNGHLAMASSVYDQLNLDKVWFMPSKRPPHKDNSIILPDEDRRRMVKHAIAPIKHFEFSDMELKRDKTTYTVDTLTELEQTCPDDRFFFIIGGDSLEMFESWRKPEVIVKKCQLVVVNRGDIKEEIMDGLIEKYNKKFDTHIIKVDMPLMDISSSNLRKMFREKREVRPFVPIDVVNYIKFNGFYGTKPGFKSKPSDKKVINTIKSCVNNRRYIHILGVAMTASNLATAHDCDEHKAYRAGLLHDCAKFYKDYEYIDKCMEYGILITDQEKNTPALLHAKLGAYMAEHYYLETDEDLLNSITWHTLGHPEMSKLEMIIFVADYIEPGRDCNPRPFSLSEIRKTAYIDLEKAVYMCAECTLSYLEYSGEKISEDDPLVITRDYYKQFM